MSGQAPTAAELEVQRLRAALAVAEAKASAVCEARVVPTASAAPVSHADTTQVLTAVAQADARELSVRQGVLRAVAEADAMERAAGGRGREPPRQPPPTRTGGAAPSGASRNGGSHPPATTREKVELAAMIVFVCGIIAGGSYYIAHIFFGVKEEQPTRPGEEDHNTADGKRMEKYVKFGFTLAFMLLMMCFFWCVCRDSCKRKWSSVVRSRFRPSPRDELAHQRMLHHESEMAAARALSLEENSV